MEETTQRSRLREFQTSLAERLRIAAATPQSGTSKLGVRIGQRRWLIDLSEAGEILSVPQITSVPLTSDWFKGLVNVRGNLLSVVDVQQFLGQGPTPIDKDSRLLAFNTKLQFPGAILVSRMLGLRSALQMQPHDGQAAAQSWIGQSYQDNEGEVWSELRFGQLIADDGYLRVGRHLMV